MIKVGDQVRIISLNKFGVVIDLNYKKERLTLALNQNYKIELPIKDIEKAFSKEILKSKRIYSPSHKESLNFQKVYCEIDFHGYRKEEAIEYLKYWTSESIRHGMKFARIIHGRGDGVLRNAIRNYFNKTNYAKIVVDQGKKQCDASTEIEFI